MLKTVDKYMLNDFSVDKINCTITFYDVARKKYITRKYITNSKYRYNYIFVYINQKYRIEF